MGVPDTAASLRMLSDHFVNRCLGTLFMHRGPMWARPKIDAFFQDVFYRKAIFTQAQQTQIEAWQGQWTPLDSLQFGELSRLLVDSLNERQRNYVMAPHGNLAR